MSYWFLYNQTSGVIKDNTVSPYHGSVIEWTNIPNGYGVVGPITDTDTTAQDAFVKPDEYTVQSGTLVHSNTPTAAQQLSDAKTAQIEQLQVGLNQTLAGGFTSKTTGHGYVTTTNGQSNMEGDLKRFDLDSTLTSVQFYTTDAGWLSHTHQDLINAFLDGGKWKDAQYTQYSNLESQVNSQTTISGVQSITWTPATY